MTTTIGLGSVWLAALVIGAAAVALLAMLWPRGRRSHRGDAWSDAGFVDSGPASHGTYLSHTFGGHDHAHAPPVHGHPGDDCGTDFGSGSGHDFSGGSGGDFGGGNFGGGGDCGGGGGDGGGGGGD